MKCKLRVCVFAVAALLVCTGIAHAQSAGSGGGAFADAYLIPTVVCQAGTATQSNNTGSTATFCSQPGGGPKILFSDIKVPSANNKDVLLMASLETSILTDTLVSTNGGNKSTASAFGSIILTPHVYSCANNDCSLAANLTECTSNAVASPCAVFPDHVTFDERLQSLSATLGSACFAGAGGVVTCTSPQTIDLLLSTMSAHGFNFLIHNLSAGVYQIQFEIEVSTTASTNSITAGSTVNAGVGAGSLVNLLVQAETPFDTITLCPGTNNSGGPNACGP